MAEKKTYIGIKTQRGTIHFGIRLPGRKSRMIAVQEGSVIRTIGRFHDDDGAEEVARVIGELFGTEDTDG